MNHSPSTVATLRLVGLIREVDGPDPHLFSEFWLNRGLRQCEASPCHLAEIIRNGHQASPERSNQNMCKLSALLFRQSQRSVRTENLGRVISVFIVKRRFALLGSRPSRASDLLRWALSPPHGSETTEAAGYPALARSHQRIGQLRPSISASVAQQPGTPEPPGTPPQPPPDPTAPPPYEDPPRPIPIPRPDEQSRSYLTLF
jgi:hypothetical protein